MEDEKVYFSLEQVAEVCGQSVESIKCKIFEDYFLLPSYTIKMPIRSALHIELQTQSEKEKGEFGRKFHFLFGARDLCMIPKRIKQPLSPYVSTIEKAQFFDSINTERRRQQNPFNAGFTGIVDIFNIYGNRHSGEFDGNIELHPESRRKIISRSDMEDFLTRPRLSYSTQSGLRIELYLLERCEFSEDELIVRRENLINAISHNNTAMQRLKQLDERLSASRGAPEPELPPDEPAEPAVIATGRREATTKAPRKSTGGNKEPFTVILDAFLDEKYPRHNPTMFYEYVKLQLTRKAAKIKDDNFIFPVDRIGSKTNKGVRMEEAKRGCDGLEEAHFWYTHKYIGERLSTAKRVRKL